jgi:hypothetical protein
MDDEIFDDGADVAAAFVATERAATSRDPRPAAARPSTNGANGDTGP